MCLAFVIFLTRPLHIQFTAKGHGNAAVQSSHRLPTPRIGGLAVILGGFLGAFTLDATTFNLVSFLAISALPVFLGGLGEDVGFNVSAKMRLVLSFASALLAGILLVAWIPRMGFPVLEILTLYTFPAMILTFLISGGISHSLNLIDGLNGLAIGVSIVIALGLMSVAVSEGDYQISYILLLIMGALLGLLVFNYRFGKLFLEESGAYCTGHILAWIAILSAQQTPRDCSLLIAVDLLLAYCGYDIFNISPLSLWQANRPTGSASFSSIGDARAGINIAVSKAERPDQSIGYINYRAIGLSADCCRGDASKQ